MIPRPPIVSRQELKRPPVRRRAAVTIVAGFRCSAGIVLCADTQETIGNISKRNVPKLRFEEAVFGSDLGVAFCGATNNGAFVDKLVDMAWTAAKHKQSIEEACGAIEVSIKDTHQEYGTIYQPGFLPDVELIYGVKMQGESRLFYALGPAVNEKEEYCTGGFGSYMADFLAERMYSYGLTVQQCVILAAYILFQTKEHVEGCGGKSHIAILREDAPSGLVDPDRIDAITDNLERADRNLGQLLLASSNLDLSDMEFTAKATEIIEFLHMFRTEQQKDFKKWQQFKEAFQALYGLSGKPDSFGLITPSSDQKSEPEP